MPALSKPKDNLLLKTDMVAYVHCISPSCTSQVQSSYSCKVPELEVLTVQSSYGAKFLRSYVQLKIPTGSSDGLRANIFSH
jgi:hypothetical protein